MRQTFRIKMHEKCVSAKGHNNVLTDVLDNTVTGGPFHGRKKCSERAERREEKAKKGERDGLKALVPIENTKSWGGSTGTPARCR